MATTTTANEVLEQIKERVDRLGLTAYRISQDLGGNPTPETVGKFLKGGVINSDYLFQILDLLGWKPVLKWGKK